jgi:hypothetical protein
VIPFCEERGGVGGVGEGFEREEERWGISRDSQREEERTRKR